MHVNCYIQQKEKYDCYSFTEMEVLKEINFVILNYSTLPFIRPRRYSDGKQPVKQEIWISENGPFKMKI